MARNATWQNPDGLAVGFGTHTSDNEMFAEVNRLGNRVVVQGYLVMASVTDTYADQNYPWHQNSYIIPRGTLCSRGTLQAVAASTTGSTSLLDIGAWSEGLATEVVDDADGFQDGLDDAELNPIGEYHRMDGAFIVAPGSSAVAIGATANNACIVSAEWETAVFTAGTTLVTLEFQIPYGAAGATLTA